jgi:hypothetical protein
MKIALTPSPSPIAADGGERGAGRLFSRELSMKHLFDSGDENRLCPFAPLRFNVQLFS